MSNSPSAGIFFEIHSELPREGPGDNASTRKAFSMLTGLADVPRILDVGCGPGMQTIELAKISNGGITALDTHQPFLDEVDRRAGTAGLTGRIKTIRGSMFSMPFKNDSFDVIWAEGVIYMIGLREGLTQWKPLLARNGYVAVTYPCWLRPDIPEEVRAIWAADFPGMDTLENTLQVIERSNYNVLGHFTLADSAWWNDYYIPLEARLVALRAKYAGDPAALAQIDASQGEIDAFRTYSQYYGYVFFAMQRRT